MPAPYAVMVSILGARGAVLGIDAFRLRSPLRPLDRDVLLLPETIFNDRPVEIPAVMRPLLDALWQSFGMRGCTEYSESGQWTPRR
jgi:hypothetical protein